MDIEVEASLEELRKQVESEEKAVVETPAETEETAEIDEKPAKKRGRPKKEVVKEPEEPVIEAAQEDEEDADEGDEPAESDDSAWAKADEEPKESPKFTEKDIAAVRHKWKGKAKEKDAEIENLRKKVEELEKVRIQPAQIGNEPKREDFDDDDLFVKATAAHQARIILAETQTATAAELKKKEAEATRKKVEQEVDAHYDRAIPLCEKSGISPETYQAADMNFRSAVESVHAGAGDAITDGLIARLGPGSEKVLYNVAINPSKLTHLKNLFLEDETGIKAAGYLFELKATLNSVAKRETRAPDPMDEIKGDKSTVNPVRSYQNKYDKAMDSGDTQAAYNILKSAREKGLKIKTY